MRLVDHRHATHHGDLRFLAFDRLGTLARELERVGRHHLAGDDMIQQHVLQCGLVLAQRGQRRGRHLREGFVRRGEHRERARALERLDQASVGEKLGERLERTGGDRRLHDVLVLRLHDRRGGHGEHGANNQYGQLTHQLELRKVDVSFSCRTNRPYLAEHELSDPGSVSDQL